MCHSQPFGLLKNKVTFTLNSVQQNDTFLILQSPHYKCLSPLGSIVSRNEVQNLILCIPFEKTYKTYKILTPFATLKFC